MGARQSRHSEPPPRGHAVLFNFGNFRDFSKRRRASRRDVRRLRRSLRDRCHVDRFYDLSTIKFLRKLQKYAIRDFTGVEYFFCFLSSHGDSGDVVHTRDGKVPIRTILELFSDANCPGLRGKPKLFMVQMCRGKRHDLGVVPPPPSAPQTVASLIGDEERSPTAVADAEVEATPVNTGADLISYNNVLGYLKAALSPDTLVTFSTPPGRFSLRNVYTGGYYVQFFVRTVEEFKRAGRELNVNTLLTVTNHSLARELTANVVDHKNSTRDETYYLQCKQVAFCVSSLRTKMVL